MSGTSSTCLDCGMSIIGDRDRCPACSQHTRQESLGQTLLAWFVAAEIIGMVVLGLVLAVRGCG